MNGATGSKGGKQMLFAILRAIFFVIAGILLGYMFGLTPQETRTPGALEDQKPIRSKTTYDFINPLLAYDSPEAAGEFKEYADLESLFSTEIARAKEAGEASRVSLYFRDLNHGRWVGINENEGYEPASMLKVVIMMAYFKEAEYDPTVLDEKLTYDVSAAKILTLIPNEAPSALAVGRSYSVRELINSMITESDNGAKDILIAHVSNRVLRDTYSDLGIPNPEDVSGEYVISTKTYSLFLRVLYNATYLSRTMSEAALKIMGRATYQDGLVAGLPFGTRVAQKFGEHVYTGVGGKISGIALSNCGVIYAPFHPFILCVMTRGSDTQKLSGVIRNITTIAYGAIMKDGSE